MASSNQSAVDEHLDGMEAENPTNGVSNSLANADSSGSNQRRNNNSLFRGSRGSEDYSFEEDAIDQQLVVNNNEGDIPATNGTSNPASSNPEQPTINVNENDEEDEIETEDEDEDEENNGLTYSVNLNGGGGNDDVSVLGSSGGSGSDSSSSSEEEEEDIGGINNGRVGLSLAANNNNVVVHPAKPNKQLLKAKKPPPCLGNPGHKKCQKAFNNERQRCDYAAEQLESHITAVTQYQGQLKSLEQDNKRLTRMLTGSEKTTTKLKESVVQLMSKLSDGKSEKKSLKSELKSKEKEFRDKVAAQKKELKQKEDLFKSHLGLEKEKTKGKELLLKKAELDLKNATKNVGDLRKKLDAMQAETNKLRLKLAQQSNAVGGTKRSSAADIDNIEAKKQLTEHSSNVRLQEYLTKAQISNMQQQEKNKANSENRQKRITDIANISRMTGGQGLNLSQISTWGNMGNMLAGAMGAGSITSSGGLSNNMLATMPPQMQPGMMSNTPNGMMNAFGQPQQPMLMQPMGMNGMGMGNGMVMQMQPQQMMQMQQQSMQQQPMQQQPMQQQPMQQHQMQQHQMQQHQMQQQPMQQQPMQQQSFQPQQQPMQQQSLQPQQQPMQQQSLQPQQQQALLAPNQSMQQHSVSTLEDPSFAENQQRNEEQEDAATHGIQSVFGGPNAHSQMQGQLVGQGGGITTTVGHLGNDRQQHNGPGSSVHVTPRPIIRSMEQQQNNNNNNNANAGN